MAQFLVTPTGGRFCKARQVGAQTVEAKDLHDLRTKVLPAFHRYHRRHDLAEVLHKTEREIRIYDDNWSVVATLQIEEIK